MVGTIRQSIRTRTPLSVWTVKAKLHNDLMQQLLYPPGDVLAARFRAVFAHPVHNFLRKYYRYVPNELIKYSPGMGVTLENANKYIHCELLSSSCAQYDDNGCRFDYPMGSPPFSRYGKASLTKRRDILRATSARKPFFGCFGLHEWAMLYSGAQSASSSGPPKERHQELLALRVPQNVVDSTVATSSLRCTHYDAWRFFHPAAQPLNLHHPMTRQAQAAHEQPGCVHANMDLFRYAYELYPLLPAELLADALRLAIRCRQVDMRASPYDVSAFEGCAEPICVETPEGRRRFAAEQEQLAQQAAPVRAALLLAYEEVLLRLADQQR